MSTIVIHAGAAKSGSSSIQSWLRTHADELRRDRDIWPVVAAFDGDADESRRGIDQVRIEAYDGGRINCGPFMRRYFSDGADKGAIAGSFVDGLSKHAEKHPFVVVSCEALAQAFCRYDELFVGELDKLGSTHDVRVAYYVRPQHTSLEAAWRQWGFRSGESPCEYIGKRSAILHYFQTLDWTRKAAPRISFQVRPFLPDLLEEGGIVNDFIRHFLSAGDMTEESERKIWNNRGLPLEVVNLLWKAPPDRFWTSIHDNAAVDKIKELVRGIGFPETDDVRRSRILLQRHCHEVFEPGNARLIDELGWNTEHFVPPPPEDASMVSVDLKELDRLWVPKASEPELLLLYRALERAIGPGCVEKQGDNTSPRPRLARRILRSIWPSR